MSGPLINDRLAEQILEIRKSGKYNMFDVNGVQVEANALGYYELVVFLEEHPGLYANFILTGNQG